MNYQQTAECVSSGHPDKIADAIADSIVDLYLHNDPQSKVAVEALVFKNNVVLAGEISSKYLVSLAQVEETTRKTIEAIGYHTNQEYDFDCQTLAITDNLHTQSPEINQGLIAGGAGDQGIMFGYATKETKQRLPLAQVIAAELMRNHDAYRLTKEYFTQFKPDAKSQVTISYENSTVRIEQITLALSHHKNVDVKFYATMLIKNTLEQLGYQTLITPDTKFIVNGTGSFILSGPAADCGTVGRKIVIDQTFAAQVGGGAFSGKDPSKVDRSAAYFARYIANHLVEAGISDEVTVGLAYTIGKSTTDSFNLDLHQNHSRFTQHHPRFTNADVCQIVQSFFNTNPAEIVKTLSLRNTVYSRYNQYGHYCHPSAPWEQINPEIIAGLKDLLL